jgi:hypothetical protein
MASEYTDGKQHVFVFRTGAGELVIGTNALREIAAQDWFREFLSLTEGVHVPQQVQPMQISQENVAFAELQREVMELRRRQQQLQQAVQVPQQTQLQPIVQEATQQMRSPIPRRFLDITPDVMTKEIWESLSTEQQTQWQEKYPPR